MAPVLSVLTAALFASAAYANPIVEARGSINPISFAKSVNKANLKNLVKRDLARARALKAGRSAFNNDAIVNVPVTNEAVTYVASVAVGNPSTSFSLIVDTGSSNTWVGAGTKFKSTNTSTNTRIGVAVTYGSGSFSGTEFTDRVSLSPSLVIPKQSIGVASTSTGFGGVDGILGIGPVDLTQGTLSGHANTLIPTVTDNLFSQGAITSNLVAVSFAPTTTEVIANGELTFGGTDSSKFSGSITFTPITKTSPASLFWGINESINFGGTNILSSTAGIVDTGTTLVLIASDAFARYQSATGGVVDNVNTGLIQFTSAQFANLKNLNFVINGVTFGLTPNAQLWPRSLNTDIGGIAGNFYGIVADLGSDSGEGLDFINGQTFLERFYSVFDTANKRVGFATTPFTGATSN